MTYLDGQFGSRMLAMDIIQGHDCPARSPDLNPLDFFLLGFSKAHSLHSQATHHAGAQEKDHPGGGQPGQVNDQKGLC